MRDPVALGPERFLVYNLAIAWAFVILSASSAGLPAGHWACQSRGHSVSIEMLKALELAGFKSFADRTRFDFPEGITVVVGPNGSGKSNIVDAIKWVLGSQSAKSLRGKEMADVIFKGSQNRGPAGTAEATIIFDNSSGALAVDASEVRVTRRVFLSGEGEYLINNHPCRLKDVKELVRGTGIGIDAYSLIEQGKVDQMLQANAKDRRAIFEEAAGISRFKAKRVEAERRLLRVQQNLIRLGDIVDEVAGRLQSLKTQASKAERYRQATERLRELRTLVAWNDWSVLSAESEQAEADLRAAQQQQRQFESRRDELALERQSIEERLQDVAEAVRQAEQQRGEIGRSIANHTGAREADMAAVDGLGESIHKSRRRMRLLKNQTGSAAEGLQTVVRQWQAYWQEFEAAKQRLNSAQEEKSRREQVVAEAMTERDLVQRQHLDTLRLIADSEGCLQRTDQELSGAQRTVAELSRRRDSLEAELAVAAAEVSVHGEELTSEEASIAQLEQRIEAAQCDIDAERRNLQRRRDEIASLKVRLQGIAERVSVLDDLQRRQEGLSGGVRSLVDRMRSGGDGPLSDVVGIVGQLFRSDVHVAPLIDAALGERAQFAVVRGGRVQDAILRGEVELSGRVGLIRIDELPARRPGDRIRLDGLRGVIGRADRMIQTEKHLQPLARHLLGTTWMVDAIGTALGLRRLSGAGLRFVTNRCELLEQDGSVIIGPPGAAAGLVSRHSELLAAQEERKHYRFQLLECEAVAAQLAERLDQDEANLGRTEQQHRNLVVRRAATEANLRHARDRLAGLKQSDTELVEQLAIARSTLSHAENAKVLLLAELDERRGAAQRWEQAAQRVDAALLVARQSLQEATNHLTDMSVQAARVEQKVEATQATIDQQRRDQTQREAAVEEVRNLVRSDRARRDHLAGRILAATQSIADLEARDQDVQSQQAKCSTAAAEIRAEGRSGQLAYEQAIKQASDAAQQVHLFSSRLDAALLKRQTLADRLLEDYEIDLRNETPPETLEPIADRAAVEEDIQHLRQQLQKTGAVNMEALDELQSLQARYDELHGQYQDLTAAKDSLLRIIGKINADSRRLFVDTLEAIRQNFQRLYRKSFGGGTADLILEDSDDPLEAGVEIIATPPGKPSFNNSLLSGGEKALTAVALLMAIFQFRPSPFCVLDEVDAPFDEANIGRFVTVLREFLDQTKFVVVTHSKKTMTAATTLYGVTMQESGISKQVSIRFEDVSEDGEISTDAA